MTPQQIQQRAREAGCEWLHEPLAQRLCTLARADLEAENEKLRNHIKHIGNDALRSENAQLREQVRKEQMYVQELAADAARYRAMRNACATQDHAFMDALQNHAPETLEQFDAAIDTAMKETK